MLLKQVEHQITTLQSTLGIAARVVEGRPLDQPDQHRHLMNLQFGKRLAEEILTGQTETVHCTLTVLTDKHLIEVSLENFLLAVMDLQQDRHHGLGELAGQAALVGQVEVLDQLLGQRTAALAHLPLRSIHPDSPGNGLGRHAEVVIEIAVLDRHQPVEQIRRCLIKLDQDPVFEVLRVKPADQQGLKPRHGKLGTIARRQVGDVITGKAHAHLLSRISAFVELETPRVEVDGIAIHRRSARTIRDAFAAITQGVEFDEKIIAAQLLSDEQLQRSCIDLGRNGPALAGELLLNDCIEVNGQAAQQNQADNTELQRPAQPLVQAARRLLFRRTRGAGSSHGRGLYAL
ncbi:hypothetical protein ALP17_05455 [Pseudomonas savastanoi]|uniref:Uncharacterized protein n=1 Tax=Pseudomonas savastanoi TaxID=29438 RepID=A0A3M6AHR2_PSESS|nr:hypothetical protein ALP17_05455 [Pseudomonas savastanoi]